LINQKEFSKKNDESINSLDLSLVKGKAPKLLNPINLKKNKKTN
jgi:hypothetical protein